MNKKLFLESINTIITGLEGVKSALQEDVQGTTKPLAQPDSKAEVVKEEVVKEDTATEGSIDIEELKAMKYNDLKKLAKEMGLDATGTKDVLIERITATPVEIVEEDVIEEEEVEEIIDEEVEEDLEEEETEDEEIEEEEEMTVQEQVEKELADYSEEEIADILESVGISPKGKRQALISKVVKAIEEGLLSFDEEESEEEEEVDEDEVDSVEVDEEEEVETDEEVEDDILVPSTEIREKELIRIEKSIRKDYKDGKISDKEINDTLKEVYGDEFDTKLPKNEKLDMYIDMYKRMIDDEGEQHDLEEPYFINDKAVCCGNYLQELEDKMYCEICGTEYDEE